MGAVIRTGLVVAAILWAVSTLAPDSPRVTVGSKSVTLKMRSVRQGFFLVGALGAGVWYAMRRDRQSQQPGVTVTHATDSPAVFRAEATPVGEPPVVTVAEPPPNTEARTEPLLLFCRRDMVQQARELVASAAGPASAVTTESTAGPVGKSVDAPLAWESFYHHLLDRQDAIDKRLDELTIAAGVRQSVEHRLDVHEAQIQELAEDVAELMAAKPKPRGKKGTA